MLCRHVLLLFFNLLCVFKIAFKLVKRDFTGFIEELGQDAAPPVPPPEGPFQQADDEPFDQLGQVVNCLTVHKIMDSFLNRCLVLLRPSCLGCLVVVLVLWVALLPGLWAPGQDSGWYYRPRSIVL